MKVKEISRNAYIIRDFEKHVVILQSYDSKVAVVKYEEQRTVVTLGKHWDYSVTTLKHVHKFLEEFAPNVEMNIKRTKKNAIEEQIKLGNIIYDKKMV